jgi:prefoldin subunit 5
MAALILVFIGFGIKIRRKANEMIMSIQAKIKKLQESGKKKKKV